MGKFRRNRDRDVILRGGDAGTRDLTPGEELVQSTGGARGAACIHFSQIDASSLTRS
jgi:hypothetical protein